MLVASLTRSTRRHVVHEWRHEVVHTQDPTTGQAGMDDRFDFHPLERRTPRQELALITWVTRPGPYSTNDLERSYHCIARGQRWRVLPNVSLTVTNNSMVGPTIAQAIINTTGGQSGQHPRVSLDLLVPPKAGTSWNAWILGMCSWENLPKSVRSLELRRCSEVGGNGIADLNFSLSVTAGFTQSLRGLHSCGRQQQEQHVTVDTSVPGLKTGTITVTSNDPDQPIKTFTVKANVLPLQIAPPARRLVDHLLEHHHVADYDVMVLGDDQSLFCHLLIVRIADSVVVPANSRSRIASAAHGSPRLQATRLHTSPGASQHCSDSGLYTAR